MKNSIKIILGLLLLGQLVQVHARGTLALGYDEGLAGRYFFSDNMGAQLSIGFEHLGDNDGSGGNSSATDMSIGASFLYNMFGSDRINLDAVGQVAFTHDDTRDPDDHGDRNSIFLRAALAPELMLGDHLGLGLKFGIELVSAGETEGPGPGGTTVNNNDDYVDLRFFAPDNPFGGSILGFSLFFYFGGGSSNTGSTLPTSTSSDY